MQSDFSIVKIGFSDQERFSYWWRKTGVPEGLPLGDLGVIWKMLHCMATFLWLKFLIYVSKYSEMFSRCHCMGSSSQ